MAQGYAGGMSSGGRNYWYGTMQSLRPYQSSYRPEEGKITESDIAGKSRRLDEDTKNLINQLDLQALEEKYQQKELAGEERIQKRALDRQKQSTTGSMALTAAKFVPPLTHIGRGLATGLFNTAGGVGIGSTIAPILSTMSPLLLGVGMVKLLQGAGLLDRKLFRPWEWTRKGKKIF